MNNPTVTKNITAFFVLTFIFALPVYIIAVLVPQEMARTLGLPLTFSPIIAVLILVYRENGADGIKKLLKSSFDYKRIPQKIWVVPIIVIPSIIIIMAYGVLILIGEPLPDTLMPLVAIPLVFLLFFLLSLFEELGWMGYAFDPMQGRWNALKAGLILGGIHATWHMPIFIAAGLSPVWIVGHCIFLVGMRIIQVWIYNNTGKSIFGQILFHAMYNVFIAVLPLYGSPLGPGLAAIFAVIIAVTVVFLWGPETLAKFRWEKAGNLA